MEEMAKDYAILAGRIVTIIPLLLVVALWMGRRSIAEVPVFDFLVVLTLGAVVGADIAEPKVPHLHTAAAVIGVALLQMTVSKLAVKFRKFGRLISFEPALVIRDGVFLEQNMKKIRYPIDNLLQMLREHDVFDLNEVDAAILEANGKLTVMKKAQKVSVTREDLNLEVKASGLAFPVVVEGKVYHDVLARLHVTGLWLNEQLQKQGVQDVRDVFYASLTEQHDLHVSLRNAGLSNMPPLHH